MGKPDPKSWKKNYQPVLFVRKNKQKNQQKNGVMELLKWNVISVNARTNSILINQTKVVGQFQNKTNFHLQKYVGKDFFSAFYYFNCINSN